MGVKLLRANIDDARVLHEMQVEAFKGLLEKYQDFDTNPASESIEKTKERLKHNFSYFYFICVETKKVGAVRVVDENIPNKMKKISPIFILPEFRGQGLAQKAIQLCEEIHGGNDWELATILQEPKNCHLYEKMGYRRTEKTEVINEKLTLVFYIKNHFVGNDPDKHMDNLK